MFVERKQAMSGPRRLVGFALSGLLALSSVAVAQQSAPRPPGDVPLRGGPGGERRADVMGRVTSVSPDGRTITITPPPQRPGAPDGQPAPRPEPVNVVLTDRTQTLFFGVGEGEARPAAGMMAMVWLDEGSRDQATRVRFMRREGEERPDVQGRVIGASPDGRTVTVETRGEGGPTGRVDLRIAPYTQVLYYGVDRDGARPTTDYQVVAWLEKGSKDTPVRVRFMKNEGPGGPGAPAPQPR
jgi:hypothetical protein